ncbi:MAG: DUF3105 domain-containing protein [Acidimicrobiia bacterium]|nr:DUF3105 domain-containing protein [Acidimicrobiia bacterium]
MTRWHLRTAVAVSLGLVAAGCGGDDADSSVCSAPVREALDQQSLVHVLADDQVEYLTDPPTSGPHAPGASAVGVLDTPLPRPTQVGVLEAGGILLQHNGLDPAAQADLESLAADGVVVAPNPDAPDPVTATAWLHKQVCETTDTATLIAFIEDHRNQGPGSD